MSGKKIYFASDLHLGAPTHAASLKREKHFVCWLDSIKDKASDVYLLGDVFDFWFEYKHAVPKGFTRILGKLAEMSDAGIHIHFFTGNHDMWVRDYFEKEIGARVVNEPEVVSHFGKKYFLAHGDGLGPGDSGYKFLKKMFKNRMLKWSFARIHPNTGIGIAQYFSRRSRKGNANLDQVDYGENEYLLVFSKEISAQQPDLTYFIFGHRHFPVNKEFEKNKFYINLGDWISHFTYLEADETGVRLFRFGDDAVSVPLQG